MPHKKPAPQSRHHLEQSFLQILDAINDMVLVKGDKSRILWANKAFCDFYGMSNEQLNGIIDAPFNEPDYTLQYIKDDSTVFSTGKTLNIPEEKVTRHDGYVGIFHTVKSAILDPKGKPIMTVGVSRDITAQKEAKDRAELHAAEISKAYAFVNAVIENIPDMIFIKEAKELRFTRFNKAGVELLGYSQEELIGKNDYDFFPKAEADFFTAKDQEVLTAGQAIDIPEELIQTRTHGNRILHTKKVPLFGDNGQPEYLLGISEDITDKKQAEVDRQMMLLEKITRAEAERALHLRDEFISVAAHELKTPLTALKMQIQLLGTFLREIESPRISKFLELLQSSQEQLDRFAKLVEDLLDVSRAEAGRLIIDRSEENLSEIVRRVVRNFEAPLSQWMRQFELHLESSVIGLWDPLRIEQVLINLLSNAMKYGAGKRIEVLTKAEGANAVLTVRDHGIGIIKEDQQRIFDRFERAVSNRAYGGLGLGLYITRQIVVAHGGRIRVESEPGQGSAFIVELPLKPAAGEKAA